MGGPSPRQSWTSSGPTETGRYPTSTSYYVRAVDADVAVGMVVFVFVVVLLVAAVVVLV